MAKRKKDTVFLKLKEKIEQRRATLSVIGLGYVGLPLAVEMARAGFRVFGIDVDPAKVNAVCKDGVLSITLPKTEKTKAIKVKVKGQ